MKKTIGLLLCVGALALTGVALTGPSEPKEFKVEVGAVITNPVGMKLRLIEPGSFAMGSTKSDDEEPVRKVTLTKPYYIGVTEVTQEQYEKVMDENPSHFVGKDLPVDRVTWSDAQDFCEELS
ncbi:SUMF1/EgtB/PvdO family nonheme iron enzyme, partial [bacterium]|nr:SUMF1/EgtB/PvdO family nonheme iron enzyme [bacterium]